MPTKEQTCACHIGDIDGLGMGEGDRESGGLRLESDDAREYREDVFCRRCGCVPVVDREEPEEDEEFFLSRRTGRCLVSDSICQE